MGLTSRGPGNTVVELCDAVEISVQSWGSGLTKHFESATSVAGVLIPPKTSRWAST